jgi:hypothetical protein
MNAQAPLLSKINHQVTETKRAAIRESVASGTAQNGSYLAMNLAAAMIAGFGLLENSPAVVVGVAIATALVPPLTTCGILLARNLPTIAAGAFLLFLANFTAIALGAMIVFLLAGHRPAAADKAKKVLAPRLVCVALVLLLAFHLHGTLRRTSAQSIMQSNIRKALGQEVAKIPGARLVDVTLVKRDGMTTVWAVARTPQPISPDQVARLNDVASNVAGRDIGLTVRSVITPKRRAMVTCMNPNFSRGGSARPVIDEPGR